MFDLVVVCITSWLTDTALMLDAILWCCLSSVMDTLLWIDHSSLATNPSFPVVLGCEFMCNIVDDLRILTARRCI